MADSSEPSAGNILPYSSDSDSPVSAQHVELILTCVHFKDSNLYGESLISIKLFFVIVAESTNLPFVVNIFTTL